MTHSAATGATSGASKRGALRTWHRAIGWLIFGATSVVILAKYVAPAALARFHLHQAHRAIRELDLASAFGRLQAAERHDPDCPEVQFLLGAVHRRAGVFRKSRQYLERAATLGYSRRDVERQQWMLMFQMGHISEFEPLLRKLLERGVSDELAEDIYEAMAMGYMADHRTPEAGSLADLWVKWRPESLRARLMRATLYESILDTENLQSELREILRINPRLVPQRLRLAQLLLDRKQVDESLEECKICEKQAPGDPHVRVQLGACLVQLGLLDEARLELESALTHPLELASRSLALTTLSQLASADGDYEATKRYCTEALELRPDDSTAAYGLGMALSRLGEPERAQEYLERSKRLLDQYHRQTEINRKLIRNPENVPLRLEMARIMVDQGRRPESAGWMQTVLRYDAKCREAHELLAAFFEERGQPELAQGHRDAAANLEVAEDANGGEAAAVGDERPPSPFGLPGS